MYATQLGIGLNFNDSARGKILLATPTNPDARADVVCGLCKPRVVLVGYNNAWFTTAPSDSPPGAPIAISLGLHLWKDFGGWAPNRWPEWTWSF